MPTLHRPRESSPNPPLHTDAEVRNRRRSIRLLRDAIEHEDNEERRFALAEELEELEAEMEELEYDGLRATRH